ncbi:hypothetical protein DY000_02035329 [Brassica cretica]|uniref:K-box domain-containing protein n=1 Tax=Brassica cretica TaxID=69181 RepID=A0ABQ7DG99_BRACR|nr:hypothetical protein DY000_02035329 [Brassica cretica]
MYRTTRGSEQRRLQCLQDIQKLQEEIKLLQISNEKLNGVGLDDMSFTELASLGSMLDEGFRIVDEQLDNVVGAHEEITTKQLFEYDLMGGPDWTQRIEKEDLAYQSLLAGRRVALRNKAREFRLSPPETQPWRSDDPERLKLDIDSLEMEKERLRLFNHSTSSSSSVFLLADPFSDGFDPIWDYLTVVLGAVDVDERVMQWLWIDTVGKLDV